MLRNTLSQSHEVLHIQSRACIARLGALLASSAFRPEMELIANTGSGRRSGRIAAPTRWGESEQLLSRLSGN